MSKQWDFLFEEGEDMRRVRSSRMEKTAGVFMRPSDIAGHTELAATLEGMLNGQPGGSTFKHEPGEVKVAGPVDMAVGAVIGGMAGYGVADRVNPVPPPQDTQGFANKLRNKRSEATQEIADNRGKYKAIGTAVGAAVGAYGLRNADMVNRIRNFKRGG